VIVESVVLGQLEAKEEHIYHFPFGIPGFEEDKQFVIVQPDAGMPFSYLQSVGSPDVALLIADPFVFYPDYDLVLNDQCIEDLRIEAEADVRIWSIVNVEDSLATATINLLAPIVVNTNTMLGRQQILHQSEYRTKHPLIRTKPQAGGVAHASSDT
jgi:flagellar assembly factor FliW